MASANKPTQTSIVSGGRRKVHSTWPDHTEMVEEYDVQTEELLVRKWKRPTALGGGGEWDFEIGEPPKTFNPDQDLLAPSNENPIFLRKDIADKFQWRVRNLPYPLEVYDVSVDHEKQQIVIRTSNKKYFKRFDIPDLNRLQLRLDPTKLTFSHANNTLIISYQKPPLVLQEEVEKKKQLAKAKQEKPAKDGDVECAQQ
eukprot:GILK01004479.1.p1 GENE.GILK01004479.1~~GILK01004479.1.p1  ORF type:complete len:212 (-),score=37.78 GILK01004479.1:205-801(-)